MFFYLIEDVQPFKRVSTFTLDGHVLQIRIRKIMISRFARRYDKMSMGWRRLHIVIWAALTLGVFWYLVEDEGFSFEFLILPIISIIGYGILLSSYFWVKDGFLDSSTEE